MKLYYFGFVLFLITGVSGCERNGKAGGPGATDPSAKSPIYGQAEDTFKLTVSSATVKPGETTQGLIGIKRGTNFAQDVSVTFLDLPVGVKVSPDAQLLKSSSSELRYVLTATETTTPGDYTIKIVGHPGTGADATNDFKLTVAKKDTFSISMPFWTTAIQQGDAKQVVITIKREAKFAQDITLTFDQLPKGISIDPPMAVIKNGNSEVKFTLNAAADAALGDFIIQATGQPAQGAAVGHEFKFTVSKK